MKPLPRLHAPELLDEPVHDMAELEQSLCHVASVNRWLGGSSAVLHYVAPLLDQPISILDVATGSADIPLALARVARRKNSNVRIVATDVHRQMVAAARTRCRTFPEIVVQQADARELPFANDSFDVVTLSLALHHFADGEQLRVLQELKRVARRLVLVNDLERTRLNYLGARLLAGTLWRRNRLTRHDGPLSVLRTFTRAELADLARRAGLGGRVDRRFFQRIVLVANMADGVGSA